MPAHWEGTGFDKAGVLHGYKVEVHKPETGKYLYATEHKLEYRLSDSYQLIKETADSFTTVHNVSLPHHGETTRTYNVNDAQGKALLATMGNFDGKQGRSTILQAVAQAVARVGNPSKAQYFFSANGQSIGSFGQLLNENSEFDVNFSPVSEQFPAATPGQVVVQKGDTLRGIAARVFGDASLWYVIAEENGLTDPDAALEEGTLIRIPNQVLSLSNSAFSFKPFDVSDAIGDTNPTQPTPKKKKRHGGLRGFLTTVLVIIVAVVITVFLTPYATAALGSNFLGAAAAAGVGSAASQGVAIGLGVQDEFSWKQVGAAALTAGIVKGTPVGELAGVVTTEPLANSVLQGALNNAVAQGVNIAVGLQDSFSWRDVAIASASSGAAAATGNWGQQQTLNSTNSTFLQQVGANAVAGAGSVLVRTAFGGKVDVASVLADIFGNAIGNSIADRIAPVPQSTLDAGIQSGIEGTRARNEAELLGMAMPTLTTEAVRQQQFQLSLQQEIERSLSNNPEFFANVPMPTANFEETVTARRGDSISTILGTSNPVAVEAFMRANRLSSSAIQAGRTYTMPGAADYGASNGDIGQAILNQDNSRLAAIAEARQRESLIAAAASEPNSFSGNVARAQLASQSANPLAGPGQYPWPDLEFGWSQTLDMVTAFGEAYGKSNRIRTLTETIDYVVRASASTGAVTMEGSGRVAANILRTEASLALQT